MYWLVFALATYSITQFFGGYRYLQSQGLLLGSLINAAWILVFVISMVYLAYKIYSEEKQRNNLRLSFAPFDVIYSNALPKSKVTTGNTRFARLLSFLMTSTAKLRFARRLGLNQKGTTNER